MKKHDGKQNRKKVKNKHNNNLSKSTNNIFNNSQDIYHNSNHQTENIENKDIKISENKHNKKGKNNFFYFVLFKLFCEKKYNWFKTYNNLRIKIISEEHLIKIYFKIKHLLKRMKNKFKPKKNKYQNSKN